MMLSSRFRVRSAAAEFRFEFDEVDPDFSSAQHISGLLTPHADFDNLRFVTVAIPTGAPPEENRP